MLITPPSKTYGPKIFHGEEVGNNRISIKVALIGTSPQAYLEVLVDKFDYYNPSFREHLEDYIHECLIERAKTF